MQLSDLNSDCLQAIAKACAGDRPTQYRLMQVSRTWFMLVLPNLYRTCLVNRPLSEYSRCRLEYVIGLNSGYVQSLYGDQAGHPPFWKDEGDGKGGPPTLPSMVDYASYVREVSSTAMMYQWNLPSWTVPNPVPPPPLPVLTPIPGAFRFGGPATDTNTIDLGVALKFKYHLLCYGSKIRQCLDVEVQQLPTLVELVHCVPNLNKIDFRYARSRNSYKTQELNQMELIVRKHVQLFPGVLKRVVMSNQNMHWDFYVKLLHLVRPKGQQDNISEGSGPTELYLQVNTTNPLVRFQDLPTESVKDISLLLDTYGSGQVPRDTLVDPGQLLRRCRVAESYYIWTADQSAFQWAETERVEWESYRQALAKYNQLPLSLRPVMPPQRPTLPLVPVNSLKYQGTSINLLPAVSGFRDTLRKLDLDHVYGQLTTEMESWALSRWDFELPNLEILTTRGQLVDLDCLAEKCPRLKSLSLGTRDNQTPPPRDGGNGKLPPLLKYLSLTGACFSDLDYRLLKPLVHLESLSFWGSFPISTPLTPIPDLDAPNYITLENGWHFPRLRHISLVGTWGVRLQGSLVRVSPNVTNLTSTHGQLKNHAFDLDTFLPPSLLHLSKESEEHKAFKRSELVEIRLTHRCIFKPPQFRGSLKPNDLAGLFPNLKKLGF